MSTFFWDNIMFIDTDQNHILTGDNKEEERFDENVLI